MIAHSWIAALGAAGVMAAAMPLLLLPAGKPPEAAEPAATAPLTVPSPAPLQTAFERPLFAAPASEPQADLPPDAPALVGIVGRIDRDAVAMVRTAQGSSRTLAIGESVDGWRLDALAIDAASFSRGSERVRVPLPAGE